MDHRTDPPTDPDLTPVSRAADRPPATDRAGHARRAHRAEHDPDRHERAERVLLARPVPPPAPRLGLSGAQVTASALAAATSAVAASFLGVAGTIIGAVVGSLVATVGSAVYAHSLRTAGVRLRIVRVADDGTSGLPAGPGRTAPSALPADTVALPQAVPTGPAPAPRGRGPRRPAGPGRLLRPAGPGRLLRPAVAVLAGAGLALGGVTAVEGLLGHPLSSSSTSGTSLGQAVTGSAPERSAPTPAAPATTSAPTSTPTATATVPPTAPPTGTATASPTDPTTTSAPPTTEPTTGSPPSTDPTAPSSPGATAPAVP